MLQKLSDNGSMPCLCPEHDPPMFFVYEPGTHKWTCPACGHVTVFTVPLVYCLGPGEKVIKRHDPWDLADEQDNTSAPSCYYSSKCTDSLYGWYYPTC